MPMGIATRVMVTGLQSGVITEAAIRMMMIAHRHCLVSCSGVTTCRATSIHMNTGVSNDTPRPIMNQPMNVTYWFAESTGLIWVPATLNSQRMPGGMITRYPKTTPMAKNATIMTMTPMVYLRSLVLSAGDTKESISNRMTGRASMTPPNMASLNLTRKGSIGPM